MLEKIANLETEDYTQNYKVIGKQNATIQFSNKLYNTMLIEQVLIQILLILLFMIAHRYRISRIVLETLRDNIFVDDLEVHYNELFK